METQVFTPRKRLNEIKALHAARGNLKEITQACKKFRKAYPLLYKYYWQQHKLCPVCLGKRIEVKGSDPDDRLEVCERSALHWTLIP